MFDRLQQFLRSMTQDDEREPRGFTRDDPRVAAAALMYHIVDADGVVDKAERARLRELLSSEYGLGANEVDKLFSAGRRADEEAVDLYSFTSVLKRSLSEEQRVRFVELLWEMVYADGDMHEIEDNLVWRISELLGVAGRDRVMTRRRVAQSAAGRRPSTDDNEDTTET